MKKLFFKLSLIVAVLVAGYGIYSDSVNATKLTELSLNNIEALAVGGENDWISCNFYGCRVERDYDCHVYVGYYYKMTCTHHRG